MALHAPAPNFHRYPVLRVFPVIQVNSEALPIRFSGFRRVIVSTLVSSVAVVVQPVPVEVAVQVVPVAVAAMEMCNRRSV